jgi:anti-sigma-K factor RskA
MTAREDDSIMAAEYVLGLLSPDAQAEAERRLVSDAAFVQQVKTWRVRFSEFDATAEPVPADTALWDRIAQSTQSAVRPAHGEQPGLWTRFWHSLPALRTATLAAAAASVLLAIVSGLSLQYAGREAARKPVYVAILVNDTTKEAGAVVNAFADGRVEMIPLTEINVPEGRALEIWTLWDRQVGPRSVGLIDRARTTRLNLDKLPTTGPDQLFEITLEPAGGSPIGRPTGPILYKGTTSRAL